MSNTVKWGITSGAFNTLTNSVKQAWNYGLKLDSSLNDIRIVTGKSADEMERFARTANTAAKQLGASTLDYTKAALIYYQQGLSEEDVQARTNTTLKVANVTGQSGNTVSEQLTAVWNGYKVSAAEAEQYIDKLSAVAAATASDLEELSTGMGKVASAANSMGVDIDQLNAQLATIISVTRQAPESVGTALKTIFARMTDIEAGTEESGITLGKYTAEMATMGIRVLDSSNKLRDMGDVIEEVGSKWNSFTREQQVALAQTMAGTRQYNNLIALFDNWDMYTQAIETSKNSTGELQKQQDIYMESTEAHLQQLRTEAERTYKTLFDDTAVKAMTGALTNLLGVFNNLLAGVGGGLNSLGFLGFGAANIFSNQIGSAVAKHQYNKEIDKQQKQTLEQATEWLDPDLITEKMLKSLSGSAEDIFLEESSLKEKYYKVKPTMTEERQKTVDNLFKQLSPSLKKQGQLNDLKKLILKYSEEGANMEDIFSSIEDIFKSQLLGKNARPKMMQQDLQALIEGMENGLSDQKEGSLGSFLSNFIDDMLFMEDQLERSRKISAEYSTQIQLKEKSKMTPENKAELNTLRETNKLVEDISKENTLEYMNSKENFENKLYSAFKEQGINIENLFPEQQKIIDNLVDVISNKRVSGQEQYEKILAETIDRLKKVEVQVTEDLQRGQELEGELEEDFKGKSFNNVQQENETNVKTKTYSIGKIISLELTEKDIAAVTSSLSVLGNTAITVGGIFKTLGDKSLSAGDQMSQVFTSLSFLAIQGVLNWKNYKTAIDAVRRTLVKYGEVRNIKMGKETGVEGLGSAIGTLWKNRKQIASANKAKRLEAAELATSEKGFGIFGKTAGAAATKILLVVAAITAVIKVVEWFEQSNERAFKKAQENYDNISNSVNNLKQSYNGLKSSIEEYENSRKALDKLTQGTDEWKESAQELNNQLIDLLGIYPKLATMTTMENGVLTLDSTKTDKYLETIRIGQLQAQNAKIIAQEELANKKQIVDNKDLKDQLNNKDFEETVRTVTGVVGGVAGAGIAAALTGGLALIPSLLVAAGGAAAGTAAGMGLSSGGMALGSQITKRTLSDKDFEELQQKIMDTNGAILESEESLRAAGYTNEKLINNILESKSALLANTEAVKANTAANKLRQQQKIANYLEGNSAVYQGVEDQTVKDAVAAAMATIDLTKNDNYKVEGNDETIQKKYAELMGWDATKIENKFGYGIYHVRQADGTEQNYTIDDKIARQTIKENNAMKDIESQTQKYLDSVNKIKNLTTDKDLQKGLLAMVGGNDFKAENFAKENIEKIRNSLDTQVIREKFTSEDWKNLGFESASDFIQGLNNGLDNYDEGAFWKRRIETAKTNITEIESFFTSYDSGTVIDDDTYTALENKYEELQAIRQRSSHEYLEMLRQIREREEDANREGLHYQEQEMNSKIKETKKEIETLVEELAKAEKEDPSKVASLEVELKGKFDTLNKQIKEYSDKKEEINVAIKADLKSDVDDAFSLAGEFGNIQNLLSDDLELTFDEAQKIIDNGYGEILTDAKETASNTIKLNTQVKDAYIKNKQEELKASKQNKIQELEDRNTMLETQYKILEQEQIALENALTAKTEAEKISYLAQATMLDDQYKIESTKMEKEIEANDIKNEKLSTQEQNLFNAFKGMYQGDLANQKKYLEQGNINFSTYFSNIITYAKNAFNGVSLVIRKLTGDSSVTWSDIFENFKKGLDNTKKIGNEIVSSYESDTTSGLNNLEKELSNLIDDYKNAATEDGDTFNLDKVIEARKKLIESKMKDIKDQIGANDAGIAALKSSWDSLEGARKTAGATTKEYQKELEKEKDLYHDINIEIQKLTTQIERLQKEQDKLVGQKLVDNLNAQTKALNAQADAIQRKIKVNAEYEKKYLQGLLAEQGVLFNEQGDISNYDEIFDTHYKYLQELDRQKRNTDNKDAKNSISNLLSQEENDFDKMIKYIERYDTLMTQDIPSWEDNMIEALDNILEISLKKFNLNIELRLDMAEGMRDWNEFKKTIIDGVKDDDILGNAKAELENFYSYYNEEGIGAVQAGMDHVNDILFELREMDKGFASDFYGEDRASALEDLEKYYKQLMSDLTDVQELSETVRQSYLDMMDKAQEDFDQQISSYEQVANLLDHDMKLIELIYGEKSYGALDKYYQKLENNYNSQLDFQKQQVDFWREQMDSADEGTERWEKARDNWTAAVSDWKSLVNDAIENINDKYLNTIKNIFEELNNKVTNGAGLEYVKEEWDLINKNSEQYLDNINAMYGIEQLASKYQQAIDNTDSVSAQRKLNDLMTKELAALREKDKLSEYDVERANKKYEIALKQIALEEAQQNKTSMRLRRDSQGNYSYQFVANEDDIAKAEDDLAAAKNALYNFDKENYLNNLDEMYSAYEEYQQKMFEAAQINDPEERAKKELLINEQYNELINSLTEKNQTIRNNLYESAFEELSRLYDTDLEHYKQMTEEQKNILLNDLIPQWTSGVQQMADTFAGEGGLKEVCKDALLELEEATEDYRKSLEKIEASAEVAFDKVYNGEDKVIEQTRDLINENEELIGTYEDQLDAVQSVIDKLDELLDKYKEVTAAAKETAQAGYEYNYEENSNNDKPYNDSIDWSRKMAEAARQHGNITNADYQRYLKKRDDKIERNGGITSVDSDRLGRLFEAYNAGDSDATYIVDQVLNGKENFTDEFLRNKGFATGGYTGNWAGNNGKLAFLHSKELVLNKEDTENILGAVQILRSINNAIGSSVLQQAAQLSGNLAAAKVGNANGFTDTLEQNVHIEAVFPNVTKSQEIENALNNLVNTASQRSLRKR